MLQYSRAVIVVHEEPKPSADAARAVELLHLLIDDPMRQLVFLTDLDGTLVTTPQVGEHKNTLEAAHFSSSGISGHQLRPKPEQTASMHSLADLRTHRDRGLVNPAMTFIAVITAAGMDRFVTEQALREFLSHYAYYEALASSESSISFLREDLDYMGQDSRTGEPIFDLINAAFNKFVISYEAKPGDKVATPVARFSDDDGFGRSRIAQSVEVFLANLDPNDLSSQIVDLWVNSQGEFNPNSKISETITNAIEDGFGRAKILRAINRDLEFRIDGLCFHGFDQPSAARESVKSILSRYETDIVNLGGAVSVFSESGLLALNVQAEGCINKIDAFNSTIRKVPHVDGVDHKLIVYCGDTSTDAVLMNYLQQTYRDDPNVEVFCIGIGNSGVFQGSADLIVPDIDIFASLMGSLAKSGTLPETRDDIAFADCIFNPNAVGFSQAQIPHRARAQQFLAQYPDLLVGDPAGLKLGQLPSTSFITRSPQSSVGAAADFRSGRWISI